MIQPVKKLRILSLKCERLRQTNSELVKLAAEIEVLSSQSTELPADQTERLEQIREQQKEKGAVLSALAAYIAERVPVIDNVRLSGQIFIAKVAKGVKLTVQTASATPPAQAA